VWRERAEEGAKRARAGRNSGIRRLRIDAKRLSDLKIDLVNIAVVAARGQPVGSQGWTDLRHNPW
jgi:hypothetical protein